MFRALCRYALDDFYPRSPRGERRRYTARLCHYDFISIHAPREGSDHLRHHRLLATKRFLSTLPARGATYHVKAVPPSRQISIHAPREGSDLVDVPAILAIDISIHAPREGSDPHLCGHGVRHQDFYPRSPRGERRIIQMAPRPHSKFLSTLPARGATSKRPTSASITSYFYPRSPRGERQLLQRLRNLRLTISIHAPREGSDFCRQLQGLQGR